MFRKGILYIHVGWSKTGTSAIQNSLQHYCSKLKEQGILYPQSFQWPDHSHHPFALAFKDSIVGYKSKMTDIEALEKLDLEMQESGLSNVLISSELSPMYFANDHFKHYVRRSFRKVKIIFTIRRQSEMLLSLFNQLVKDPNVRFNSSIFLLGMRNLCHYNFYEVIAGWAKVVGKRNIKVITYDRTIVNKFLGYFDIKLDISEHPDTQKNSSIPNQILLLIQHFGKKVNSNQEYLGLQNEFIQNLAEYEGKYGNEIIFSNFEQQAFDSYFRQSNEQLAKQYQLDNGFYKKIEYKSIRGVSPKVLKYPYDILNAVE